MSLLETSSYISSGNGHLTNFQFQNILYSMDDTMHLNLCYGC